MRSESDWSSYLIPQGAAPEPAPEASGSPLRIKTVSASTEKSPAAAAIDGDIDSIWSSGKQDAAVTFTVELQDASHVGQIVTDLGPFSGEFPARLRIDVSADGSHWDTVSEGSTALRTYDAAIRHPKEVPVVYPIGRDGVRFIRLEQRGVSTRPWSIAEVRVLR